MHEEDSRPDGRSLADHRLTAENGGIGVDRHMITDIGMAFAALDDFTDLVALKTAGSQRDGMVQFHMVSDAAAFPDNDAR